MLAATKVKMSGSEKTERTGRNISSIKHVTRKLKEVSHFSRAKQQQGNVQKKCAARAKLFLCLLEKKVCSTCKVVLLLIRSRYIVAVFHCSHCLHLASSITQFYIFFEETINIKDSFAFSPG